MIWAEFLKETGCRQTPENYRVYNLMETLKKNGKISEMEVLKWGMAIISNTKVDEEKIYNLERKEQIKLQILEFLNTKKFYENMSKKGWYEPKVSKFYAKLSENCSNKIADLALELQKIEQEN